MLSALIGERIVVVTDWRSGRNCFPPPTDGRTSVELKHVPLGGEDHVGINVIEWIVLSGIARHYQHEMLRKEGNRERRTACTYFVEGEVEILESLTVDGMY